MHRGKMETQGKGAERTETEIWEERQRQRSRGKGGQGREGERRTQMELTAGEVELIGRKAPQMPLRWLLGPGLLLSP